MAISSSFEGGNIEFVAQRQNIFDLRIKPDSNAKYFQWFYFSAVGMAGKDCQFKIINAAAASYPEGWQDYQAVASYDRKTWFRVPTSYKDGVLIINHKPEQKLVFYAYFVPYSYERYLDWISALQSQCHVEPLATTADGRLMHCIRIGEPEAYKRTCWIIARQHAGEIMASWFIEKLVADLLDTQDATSRLLLNDAVFYIVPLMNPDGAARGHLRANANGLDLNRQWQAPDEKTCPEVFYTRQKMREIGVDFFLDAHGDEAIPYVFLAGCNDNLNYTERQEQLDQAFRKALLSFTPEFQTQYGYEKSQFKESTPTLACNHVGEYFDCLALTLEMPFKDNHNLPDKLHGWSPERSAAFAKPVLQAIKVVLPKLR